MKKILVSLFMTITLAVFVSGCGLFLDRALNDLRPGMTRAQVMANGTIREGVHATEFEMDDMGNKIERLIFRMPVSESGKTVGYEWVTLWFKNGTLVEKRQEFVPLPPTFPAFPIPVKESK
ncbi:hypothetical protein [Porphyromonas sp.]|uniref:hypothetical protein n=1 Tax=Porphyromonas sp. TaxID=1924944 RepID=UPI0026DACEC6|nr:hypothetical protein [Porphyromonas sp.]MDO4695534.1 hypothetical protein [Porphyromonas sp.]MDO4771864.1 hypothetical protein [Porphyromonas sp.]